MNLLGVVAHVDREIRGKVVLLIVDALHEGAPLL